MTQILPTAAPKWASNSNSTTLCQCLPWPMSPPLRSHISFLTRCLPSIDSETTSGLSRKRASCHHSPSIASVGGALLHPAFHEIGLVVAVSAFGLFWWPDSLTGAGLGLAAGSLLGLLVRLGLVSERDQAQASADAQISGWP